MRQVLVVLSACLLAGCGYTFGARLPEGIATVEVPVFGNTTLVRELEFELTGALTEELKARTALALVSSNGDAKLSGAVVEYRKVPIYESSGIVIAGRITVVVVFKLESAGEENAIQEGTVSETQNFDSRSGILEQDARRKAMRILARKIVYQIEDWEAGEP